MPLLELEKVKLVELVCSHNIQFQAIKKPGVCRMDGIGFYRKSLLPKKVSFFSLYYFCFYFVCIFVATFL